MNKQDYTKIIHATHRRDELLDQLKDSADELDDTEIDKILDEIKRLNKILKRLNTYE